MHRSTGSTTYEGVTSTPRTRAARSQRLAATIGLAVASPRSNSASAAWCESRESARGQTASRCAPNCPTGQLRPMMGHSEYDPAFAERRPWNAARKPGAKRGLKPQQVWAIRFYLDRERRPRDRALFDLAIDSKLRGCDLVKDRRAATRHRRCGPIAWPGRERNRRPHSRRDRAWARTGAQSACLRFVVAHRTLTTPSRDLSLPQHGRLRGPHVVWLRSRRPRRARSSGATKRFPALVSRHAGFFSRHPVGVEQCGRALLRCERFTRSTPCTGRGP